MFAGNALITKIKSLYALRIQPEDYEVLLKKRSLSELTAYLKTLPNYRDILMGINESMVHRDRLEEQIKKNHFSLMMKLIRFIKMKDEDFYRIHVVAKEHDVILSVVKSFISDESYDVVAQLPVFFDKYSRLDILKMSQSTNLSELVESLKNTPYYALLVPYENIKNENINFFLIESVLENEYYKHVFKQIDKFYKGKTKVELSEMFKSRIEVANIIKIYRLKKFYRLDNDAIEGMLIPQFSRIDQQKIHEVLQMQNPQDIFNLLAHSKYAQYIDQNDHVYLEYYDEYIKYYEAKKNIYYAKHPAKVFLAYLMLNEIEMSNLIHLIEGIRYQVSDKEVRMMLVY